MINSLNCKLTMPCKRTGIPLRSIAVGELGR